MTRMAGFVLGVCVTLAAFLYFVQLADAPRSKGEAASVAIAIPDTQSVTLPAVDEPRPAGMVPQAGIPAAGEPPLADAFTADALQGVTDAVQGPGTRADDSPGVSESAVHRDPLVADRYVFWSPFRSKWAAQGFAGRLSLATDVPVEVVVAGPGNYRVGFRYRDEAERQARVGLIETITGLELE